ncbi:M23 family metallopeptidase [Mucilaginibacter sp.]|uniref:M23 family metallopeptidase n=1 Tax=Mucilaginibacter sp. TaxID=1882438 RepID=UPI003D0C99EE
MLKNLVLTCSVLLINGFINSNANAHSIPSADTSKLASIKISPEKPLIEKDIYGYYLNFDITIENKSKHTIELSSVEASVVDNKGKLVLRKFMNSDGKTPGIDLLVYTIIKPGEKVSIFNPFHTFPPDMTIASLKYGFFFNYADTQAQKDNNKQRLPVDFDELVVKAITPQVYIARNEYYLPLKGKIIVWDGHDFYSHNRRSAKDVVDVKVKDLNANASRYAYDLMCVDAAGSLYSGTPFKKQNWFGFGRPVYVPSDGKVIKVQTNIPDNEFIGKTVKTPVLPPNTDPYGMGNYIIIQHSNGECSELLHMGMGSISVKPGDWVKAGQQIGTVGFSGSEAIYPHLHYSVISAYKEMASEGIPNYFNDYKLYRGDVTVNIKRSRVDSGDIIESTKW